MSFRINLEDRDGATVWLYDAIGAGYFGGISAADFIREVQPLAEREITVRINSPGGDVFDGIAMFNVLRDRRRATHVIIDGVAASAASVVAMGGETIEMRAGAMYMIHEPWVHVAGNASELRHSAAVLDQVNDNLVDIYHERTGIGEDELRDALAVETWYSADEAIELGFADSMAETEAIAACVPKTFVHDFDRMPERLKARTTGPKRSKSFELLEDQVRLNRRRLLGSRA